MLLKKSLFPGNKVINMLMYRGCNEEIVRKIK
jgi:hypothetical protein